METIAYIAVAGGQRKRGGRGRVLLVGGLILLTAACTTHKRPLTTMSIRSVSSETAAEIAEKLAQMEKEAAGVQAESPKQ